MPKPNPRDIFTYVLADATGKPVLDADGKPTTKAMTDGAATVSNGWHINHKTGRKWRRETGDEMRRRR